MKLADFDAFEVHMCAKYVTPDGTIYEDRYDGTYRGEPGGHRVFGVPYHTVFGHYSKASGRHGLETICDCRDPEGAECVRSLLSQAVAG